MHDMAKNQPLISFAIPTYNFGKFIGDTIESIIEGAELIARNDYEIVVLDGGSNDDTHEVLEKLKCKYGNVRYKINPIRGGIDRDLNEVAGMCAGAYIWLFSSDDLLLKGWDRHIVPLLDRVNDICLVPAELCDYHMRHLRNNPIFHTTNSAPISFEFTNETRSIDLYLNKANTLEALFSFMSAVVVRREIWHRLKERSDFFGSCWAHCARLIPLLFQPSKIVYVNKYLIKKRGGNDSFMENGFIARIGIAVDGWSRIAFEFFEEKLHKELILSALRKDMPILLFIYAKITAKSKSDILRLDDMAFSLYWSWSIKWSEKINYIIYRSLPGATKLNIFLEPCLPHLIRLRHKFKSLISG